MDVTAQIIKMNAIVSSIDERLAGIEAALGIESAEAKAARLARDAELERIESAEAKAKAATVPVGEGDVTTPFADDLGEEDLSLTVKNPRPKNMKKGA